MTQLNDDKLSAVMAYSLAALFLYLPANLCPFMQMTMYGVTTETTIWSGIVELAKQGSWFVALVVLLASIVIPFFKLCALFFIAISAKKHMFPETILRMANFIEVIGRWSMLDIFLLAIFVGMIKLNSLANVSPGPGSLAFVGVVIFTILASAALKPKQIAEDGVIVELRKYQKSH